MITVLLFVMGMYEEKLPVEFAYVAIGIICVDVFVIMVLSSTICKKRS